MVQFIKTRISETWQRIKPHHTMPKKVRTIRWALIITGGSFLSLFALLFLLALILNFTLPSVSELADMNLEESTIIYDRKENQLYAIHGEENRIMTDLPDISNYLVEATIATEDDDFYSHFGFDIKSLTRAFINNVLGKPISGASTITQQFIKIKYLSPEKSYIRKFKELILAVKLEIFFKKDEILEMYLNEIPYGNNAYGAELAAETYFNKTASELTLAESAILAAIPNAPTYYSPYGNHKYSTINVEFTDEMLADREINEESDLGEDEYSLGLIGQTFTLSENDSVYIKGRVDIVLERMVKEEYITESQMLTALNDIPNVVFADYKPTIDAPHFVFYVKELLEEKYGTELVEQGGLKVYTTLDPDMQDYAEEAVAKYKDTNLENYNASNAALVAIQPETGQILAMVGSAEYGNEDIDGSVNMATSLRQPGSSFKPIVYALAFLNGVLSPATVLYDVQTYFGTDNPQNYSGTFRGPVSVREALGQSLNLPAIKAFFLAGGEKAVVDFAETLGITTLNHEGNYGWPLALGAGEVTLLELVNTYAVFANQGNYVETTAILKIENADGEIIEQWEEGGATQVLDPQIAYLITNVLSDTTYRLGSNLTIDGQINTAKTGTSDKKIEDGTSRPNNCLALGYTTSLVAGVWTGNADGSVMYGNADGYTTSAPIWKYFMTKALADKSAEEFSRPSDIKDVAISTATGKLPSENTPSEAIKTDIFASFAVPTELDNSYIKVEVDSQSGKLATEFTPEESKVEKVYRIYQETFTEYANWVSAVERWLTAKVEAGEIELPPTEYDDIHTAEMMSKQPSITITSPSSLSTIETGTTEIQVEVEAENGIYKVEFYTNSNLQYTATEDPYTGKIRLASTYSTTTIEVTAKVYDTYGYTAESTIELKVIKSSSDSE